MGDLDELLQKHGLPTLVYLVCRALGLSVREASERAGFSRSTGYQREQQPWWPGLFEMVQARLQDADPALLALAPDAIRAYERALGQADKAVARDVLDRVFGKPSPRRPEDKTAKQPPLLFYEQDDDRQDNHPQAPPAGAGGLYQERGGGSDV